MAFRRSVTARAKLLYQQQRVVAPFPHIHRHDNDHQIQNGNSNSKGIGVSNCRLYGRGNYLGNFHGSRNLFQDRRFGIPAARWPGFVRNMSTIGESPAEGSEIVTDIANVLGDEAVGVASQVANEVAIAAAHTSFPVAAFQYLIDYVHCYTGFNWWASIVVTTVLIRLIQLPLRNSDTVPELLKLRLKEIEEEMKSRDMSPAAVAEAEAQKIELVKEVRLATFNSLRGPLIGGSIFCCFFVALKNMAENIPSFKEGGAFWFTDLTTPDSMYILPILTVLSFWITVERAHAHVDLENRSGKSFLRVCSALTIPLTATFPKAVFFYLLTSSLYSHASRSVLRNPEVEKLLGLATTSVKQPWADKNRTSETPNKDEEAAQEKNQSEKNQSVSSSSSSSSSSASYLRLLDQRITRLEREVNEIKERKTGYSS